MRAKVVLACFQSVEGLGHALKLVDGSRVSPQARVVGNALLVALEMSVVNNVKAKLALRHQAKSGASTTHKRARTHQCREKANVRERHAITTQEAIHTIGS